MKCQFILRLGCLLCNQRSNDLQIHVTITTTMKMTTIKNDTSLTIVVGCFYIIVSQSNAICKHHTELELFKPSFYDFFKV